VFVSFVTAEKGALRLIMVSRPNGKEDARGLIMTLSNPSGLHFTPVSAPIVLKRIVAEIPQLGFIRPGGRDYDAYRRELEAVVPEFGFFAPVPDSTSVTDAIQIRQTKDTHLSVVN
jgi:hypothetical protein